MGDVGIIHTKTKSRGACKSINVMRDEVEASSYSEVPREAEHAFNLRDQVLKGRLSEI